MLQNLTEKVTKKWETMTKKEKLSVGAGLVVVAVIAVNANNDRGAHYQDRAYPLAPMDRPNYLPSGGYMMPMPAAQTPFTADISAQMTKGIVDRNARFSEAQHAVNDVVSGFHTYTDPQNNQPHHQLDNFNPQWVGPGGNTVGTYYGVTPGYGYRPLSR